MSTQDVVSQVRSFLNRVEANPRSAQKLVPATSDLLRLTASTKEELEKVTEELKAWLASQERTAS